MSKPPKENETSTEPGDENSGVQAADKLNEKLDMILDAFDRLAARVDAVEAIQSKPKNRGVVLGGPLEFGEDESLEEVMINLAPCGGVSVRVNNFDFFHGQKYKVTRGLKATLEDMARRTWAHEDEIRGINMLEYRRAQERRVGAR